MASTVTQRLTNKTIPKYRAAFKSNLNGKTVDITGRNNNSRHSLHCQPTGHHVLIFIPPQVKIVSTCLTNDNCSDHYEDRNTIAYRVMNYGGETVGVKDGYKGAVEEISLKS